VKLRDIYGSTAPFIAMSLPREDSDLREARPVTRIHSAIKVESIRSMPEPEPGEVEKIVQTWSKLLDMNLKPEHIRKHLQTLRRWQNRLIEKRDGALI
jgi:hypothetical protein